MIDLILIDFCGRQHLTKMSEDINETIINFKIITEVEKRPCLWEFEYADLEGTVVVAQAWEEVAYAVNLESTAVKSMWLLLYNKLLYKLKHRHKADDEYFQELLSWPYFQAMKFLTKTIEDSLFYKLSGVLEEQRFTNDCNIVETDTIKSSPATTVLNHDINAERADDFESSVLTEPNVNDDDYSASNIEHVYNNDDNNDIITIEEDTNVNSIPNVDLPPCPESDYLYLMTLLPLLEKLPFKRKLKVRIKIQEILYNEIYGIKN